MSKNLWPTIPRVVSRVYGACKVEIFQEADETGKPILKMVFGGDTVIYATANTMEMVGGAATGARLRWEDHNPRPVR